MPNLSPLRLRRLMIVLIMIKSLICGPASLVCSETTLKSSSSRVWHAQSAPQVSDLKVLCSSGVHFDSGSSSRCRGIVVVVSASQNLSWCSRSVFHVSNSNCMPARVCMECSVVLVCRIAGSTWCVVLSGSRLIQQVVSRQRVWS